MFHHVTAKKFHMALQYARMASHRINEFTDDSGLAACKYSCYWLFSRCYLSDDGRTGFYIAKGNLSSLFNLNGNGDGEVAVRTAIDLGAYELNCFDGFLPGYYAKFGFVVVDRIPNWNGPEYPDVVYMEYTPVIEVK